MVAMVAAGCGFYGDGPQWQEDSRGFSYLVASHPPPPTTSQQQTGAVPTVLCKAEHVSQLPPRSLTAGSWKDRPHSTVFCFQREEGTLCMNSSARTGMGGLAD